VNKISEKESNRKEPLGIIAPGILEVMELAKKYKVEGKIKGVVIYSNNANLENLVFVRDIIHTCLKRHDLIIDLIHRYHPLRWLQGEELSKVNPNAFPKTWLTLKRILIEGEAKAESNLTTGDVIFVDDNLHMDLYENLRHNYIKTKPYNFHRSFTDIVGIYLECLDEAGILKNDKAFDDYLDAVTVYNPKIPLRVNRDINSYSIFNHLMYYRHQSGYFTSPGTQPPKRDDASIALILNRLRILPKL